MNRLELRTELKNRLNVDDGDIMFFTDAKLDGFVNSSLDIIGTLHKWAQTEATEKQIIASDDNGATWFNYPENFQAKSIFKLYVGTVPYSKYNYEKYKQYKDGGSTGDYFSDYGMQLHISNALKTGDSVTILGHLVPFWIDAITYAQITTAGDTNLHPLRSSPRLEEALLKHALGLSYKKQEGSYYAKGEKEIADAIALANMVWDQMPSGVSTGKAQSSRWM